MLENVDFRKNNNVTFETSGKHHPAQELFVSEFPHTDII